MNSEVVKATVEHAVELAQDMRSADVAECRASLGEPLEALLKCLELSEFATTLVIDGKVAAMFGVGLISHTGTLLGGNDLGDAWLLTGNLVNRHPKVFLRTSRAVVAAMLQAYPVLINFIDARYAAALRWARWLGFEVFDAEPLGRNGELFHPIRLRRSQWAG